MLQDNFGRQFHYLRLSVTEMCNFRCNYCLPNGNECDTSKGNMTLNEIHTLVQAFARLGTSKIRITGGEPSLRRDLIDIISMCKNTPGIEKVAMTTNAFRLKKDVQRYADAGLDALNVSADSLDPRMFAAITGKDKLEDILAGVEHAIAVGIKHIKFNSVILKQFNLGGLTQFLNYLKTHAVTWRFIELMQTGDNASFFAANHVRGEDVKKALLAQGWQRMVREKHAGPAQEFTHSDYLGKLGLIMPYSKDFCTTCNRLRVSSSGKLHLCLFSQHGLSIRDTLSSGDIEGTCEALRAHLSLKTASHELQKGFTGATKQLAMLGG
ncbi:GTP 3',8-cyclase MoaA [Glaciecola siphonariae]|uniref:GTP 3',8-cyclase n=1 Tax=Glaciecola siphonariae TaxID=521012 RepID=A0ABV9M004_9ALTE